MTVFLPLTVVVLNRNTKCPSMYLEKNLKPLSNYADNGIVVATVDDFMQNFTSLVGYHNSVNEEDSPSPSAQERQSGNTLKTFIVSSAN